MEVRKVEIAKDVYRIEIPQLAGMTVNCYLLDNSPNWVVIDTGLNSSKGRRKWEESLAVMGVDYSQISDIVVTHHHLDHIGAAGWLQQQSGARVYILEQDYEYAHRYTEKNISRDIATDFFRAHGYTGFDTENPIVDFRKSVEKLTMPLPEMEKVQEGQILDFGSFKFEVFWTPGHAPGHMCLYDRQKAYLFSGDFLLPDISSHVGFYPGGSENPLKDVMSSLEKMRGLGARMVFPGHGPAFSDPDARIDEILHHHQIRLDKIYRLLDHPMHIAALNEIIFGERDPFNTFLAVGETAAHLELLIEQGRARKEIVDGIIMFSRT